MNGEQNNMTDPTNDSAELAAAAINQRRRSLFVNSVCRLLLGLLFVLGNILVYAFNAPPHTPWYSSFGDWRFLLGVGCTLWGIHGFWKLRTDAKPLE
jgi:uncharacterized membrane protein YgdD (TMEM256/DUF423 family)